MRDVVFIIGWGLCMAGAAQLYALTDWAVPMLLDKTNA